MRTPALAMTCPERNLHPPVTEGLPFPGEATLFFFRLEAVPFSGDLSQKAVGPKCHTRRCVLQIHSRTIDFLFPGYCDSNCAARSIQSQ